jgi:uncharacterized nucleotidyltransferase DUF6036
VKPLDEPLETLRRLLQEARPKIHQPIEIILIGGATALLSQAVNRITEDIDILASSKTVSIFSLGSDLKTAKEELKVLEARNIRREDFDQDKPIEEKTGAMTFAGWVKKYPDQQGVKNKRSLNEEKGMIRLHLTPFFGSTPLTRITRESLIRYIDNRVGETILRQGKASKKSVARGTVSNELSLLRRMLRVASREGYQVSTPSFEDLIMRVKRAGVR